ncbi:site-specific integrase [Streptomyces sp. NPDC006458]|uniref:site-specific integrase n=1 Tax=Streptomyces sp. NPDC006458 TaxID=3154302 RepID=UPI0033B5A76C
MASGLTDASGRPLTFAPHDFRRIFITDAIMNGLPPHIAQVIAGHGNINTTMGYAAIYPTDAIEAHQAFIARRRAVRPAEEYRAVTAEEWEEFLGHFERRKLALGDCGRAYGTDCVHEHACFSELKEEADLNLLCASVALQHLSLPNLSASPPMANHLLNRRGPVSAPY